MEGQPQILHFVQDDSIDFGEGLLRWDTINVRAKARTLQERNAGSEFNKLRGPLNLKPLER
jgi:hypothetical protein